MIPSNNPLLSTNNPDFINKNFTDQRCPLCLEDAFIAPEDDRYVLVRLISNLLSYINNPWEDTREPRVYFHYFNDQPAHPVHGKCYQSYLKSLGEHQRAKCLSCHIPKEIPKRVICLAEKLHDLIFSFCKNVAPFCFASLIQYMNYGLAASNKNSPIPPAFLLCKYLNANSTINRFLLFIPILILELSYLSMQFGFINPGINSIGPFIAMTTAFLATHPHHPQIPIFRNIAGEHILNISILNVAGDLLLIGTGVYLLSKFAEFPTIKNPSLLQFAPNYLCLNIVPSITHVIVSAISLAPHFVTRSNWRKKNIYALTKLACLSPIITIYYILESYKRNAIVRYKFVATILAETKDEICQKMSHCVESTTSLSSKVVYCVYDHFKRCMHPFYPMEPAAIE